MKKLLFVMLVALTIVSCQKKETETAPETQDVSFNAIEVIPDGGLKSTADWECKDNVPTNAWVRINHDNVITDYYPELFELSGQLYTQAIKLPVGADYCVEVFILYEEVDGTPGYENTGDTGDVIVFGTPTEDNDDTQGYDAYVQWPLEFCFDVTAFSKVEIPLEVLCFQDAEYDSFGFDWFAVTEIVIRQFCFFGDICIDDPSLYENDQYYSQGGVNVDEEAVIRVIVKNGNGEVPYSPFTNEAIYGSGSTMCVDYPDNLSVVNDFTFELQVWQPDGNGGFMWQTYATFYSQDDGDIYDNDQYTGDPVDGTDGVVDFAIGTCSPDSYPIFAYIDPVDPNLIENLGENDFVVHSLNLNQRFGQTFTTGTEAKDLVSVSVNLSWPGNGGLLAIDVYEFDVNSETFTLVASSNLAGYQLGPFNTSIGAINTRTFSTPPTLQPNSTYAFILRNNGWNFFNVKGTDGGTSYSGGTGFYSQAGAGSNDPNNVTYSPLAFDAYFQLVLQ